MMNLKKIQDYNYDYCFIPEPLAKIYYEQNSVRRQTYEKALELHKQNIKNYVLYYKQRKLDPEKYIVYIPTKKGDKNLSPLERAKFVLGELKTI